MSVAVLCLAVTLTGCGRSDREIRMARECYEASRAVALEYDRGGSRTDAPTDYQIAYAEALNWQDKVCD